VKAYFTNQSTPCDCLLVVPPQSLGCVVLLSVDLTVTATVELSVSVPTVGANLLSVMCFVSPKSMACVYWSITG